jgi:hypothetical protein
MALRPFVLLLLVAAGLAAPAAASAAGSLDGNIMDADGNPLTDVCVRVHDKTTASTIAGSAQTTADGDYTVAGLAANDYKVEFTDDSLACPTGVDFYFTQWYDGKLDFAAANAVAVTDGATTHNIDAVMAEPEAVAGHVQDAAGGPLASICVVAKLPSDSSTSTFPAGFAQTDVDGNYLIELPAGQYKVSFYDGGTPCNVGKYEAQWYHDKPDFASADIVTVPTARTIFGIDAVMHVPSRITGHVQDEAANPLRDICVVAGDPVTPNLPGQPPGFARTDAAGDYVMAIAPGDYKVQFYDGGFPCNVGKYVQQWFNGKSDFAAADIVHVARDATVTGIGATMKRVPTVVVTASNPPPPPAKPGCKVPKLRGVKLKQAKKRLHAAHCSVGTITRKHSKRSLVGRVVSTRPRAHAVKAPGTKVALVVGKRRI